MDISLEKSEMDEGKVEELSLLDDESSIVSITVTEHDALTAADTATSEPVASKPEISMDEIDLIIKNRVVKVSTVIPVVKQVPGQRLRMILLGQSNFDSLVSEANGVKYGAFERPDLSFYIINSASAPPVIRPTNEKVVPSVKGLTEDTDGILILYEKARNLFILSPDSADALFLRLREERARLAQRIEKDTLARSEGGTAAAGEGEEPAGVYIKHTTRTVSIGTPPPPAAVPLLPNIPLVTIHQGFCLINDKVYPDINAAAQRVFQRFLRVFLYPQLDDAEFMAKLVKRHTKVCVPLHAPWSFLFVCCVCL